MKPLQIAIRPLKEEDTSLMHRWFNEPHVQRFYSLRDWTLEEVACKLAPIISGDKGLFGRVLLLDGRPIGYLQFCSVKEHPWPDQDLDADVIEKGMGLDLFIGERDHIGKGVAHQFVELFLKSSFPSFAYCVADPDQDNTPSIRMLEKCGFHFHKEIKTENPLGKSVVLRLMVRAL